MAEEKPKSKAWLWIIIGVVAAVLLFGSMMAYFMGAAFEAARSSMCDRECFVSAANECGNATFYSDEDIGNVMYETSDCFFVKTLVSSKPDEIQEVKDLVEGKSLICQYDLGSFDERWMDTLSDGLEYCQGDLKEAIGELIIFSDAAQ